MNKELNRELDVLRRLNSGYVANEKDYNIYTAFVDNCLEKKQLCECNDGCLSCPCEVYMMLDEAKVVKSDLERKILKQADVVSKAYEKYKAKGN
ncbi:MAG: hypothetical protein LUC44_06150 [Prevotellaceae bacterium]|nr:hypothetical protein [Prevotellaceae bacterium]